MDPAPLLLLAAIVSTAIGLVSREPLFALMALPLLAGYIVLEFPALPRAGQVMAVVAAVALAAFVATGRLTWPVILDAASKAALLGSFAAIIGLLRVTAMGSRLIGLCGRGLVRQPPRRSYAILTWGGHVMALLLGFGAVGVLVGMVRRSLERRAHTSIMRLRISGMAMMRGYTATFLWAPVTLPFAVLQATIPQLRWADILPLGLPLAVAYIVLGMALDGGNGSTPTGETQPPNVAPHQPPLWQSLLKLLGLIVLLGVALGGLARWMGLGLVAALVITGIPLCIAWAALQMQRFGSRRIPALVARSICRHVPQTLRGVRGEISIGASGAIIGALLVALIDFETLDLWLEAANLSTAQTIIAIQYGQVAMGAVGLNPIVSGLVAGSLVAQLPALQPWLAEAAVIMLLTWAIVGAGSPWTMPVQMLANALGHDAWTVTVRWNGAFSALVLVASNVLVLLLVG